MEGLWGAAVACCRGIYSLHARGLRSARLLALPPRQPPAAAAAGLWSLLLDSGTPGDDCTVLQRQLSCGTDDS